MREKFRISVNDFILQYGKFPIGSKDKEGNELHLGDTVKDDREDKYMIGYRYGDYTLKQPFTMHSLIVKNYSRFERQNEITGIAQDEWLIIGYTTEPLYGSLKEVPKIKLIEVE